MHSKECEWGQGFMTLAKTQRTRRTQLAQTRRFPRHPSTEFNDTLCAACIISLNSAAFLRHALHAVQAVAKFTRQFDDNYGEKGNRECTRWNANGVKDLWLSRRRKGRGEHNCHQHADFNDTQARNSTTRSAPGAPCRTIRSGNSATRMVKRKPRMHSKEREWG
jgi:hypothetical protein